MSGVSPPDGGYSGYIRDGTLLMYPGFLLIAMSIVFGRMRIYRLVLMALFIVLWLMNTSKPIQEAVGGYFRDPKGLAAKTGTALSGSGDAAAVQKEDMNKLKDGLVNAMGKMKDFEKLKKLIEITVTPEGLQIELMEDPKGTFFENGSAKPTPIMQSIVKILSLEVGKLPNPISIEGHTDSTPYSDSKIYGNWELSTDRANTARRRVCHPRHQ